MGVELKCRKCGKPMYRGGRGNGFWLAEGGNSWCVNESTHEPPLRWFQDFRNMILLTRFMADEGASGDRIAKVVEKPWLYTPEFRESGGEVDDYTLWLAEHYNEGLVPEWTT